MAELFGYWISMRLPRVQISLWPLAAVVLGSPWSNSSVILVNSQLVFLRQLGFSPLLCFNCNYLA